MGQFRVTALYSQYWKADDKKQRECESHLDTTVVVVCVCFADLNVRLCVRALMHGCMRLCLGVLPRCLLNFLHIFILATTIPILRRLLLPLAITCHPPCSFPRKLEHLPTENLSIFQCTSARLDISYARACTPRDIHHSSSLACGLPACLPRAK